ncbi:MAG: PAS domain S-box protein [Candidatus Scalindua sp.]|nr:PAS domain S-box protein [Candidatus Scalindua sp.]
MKCGKMKKADLISEIKSLKSRMKKPSRQKEFGTVTSVKANNEIKKSQTMFSDLFEKVSDLIQCIRPDGRFVYVNNSWRKTLGYGKREIEKLALIDILHPNSQTYCMEIFKRVISGESIKNIKAIFVAKNGRNIIVEGNANCYFEDGKPVVTREIFHDITEFMRIESELRKKNSYCKLLEITAISANKAVDFKEAFQPALEAMCSYTGWEIGHAYVISKDDRNLLEPTNVWSLKDNKHFKKFCDVSKEIKFPKGIGLPGRVLASGKPHWVVDVTKDKNFLRAKIAKDLKVKSGIAFPVLAGTKIVAVLVFFTTMELEPDQQFMKAMAYVGTQLGRPIERRHAEERLKEKSGSIEQKNIALRELLGQIELEKKQIEKNVIANAENLLLPIVYKLRRKGISDKYVQILQNNLKDLTSTFGRKLTEREAKLTPREIDICNMIKNGLANKEIASLLNITLRTTEKHRAHIRNKLGIVNKDINLISFLKTL